MSNLILHVGLHKTGTTAVQYALAGARRKLALRNIHYPNFGTGAFHHGLISHWFELPAMFRIRTGVREALARLSKAHFGYNQTIVISSEEFSRNDPQSVDLSELKSFVELFDNVKIILVVRHQLDLLQSIYLEVVKSSRFIDFDTYLSESINSMSATGVPLDFAAEARRWENVFGKENVLILDYGQLATAPQGLAAALLEEVFGQSFADHVPTAPANVSLPPLAVWYAKQLKDEPSNDLGQLISICSNALATVFGGRSTCLFSEMDLLKWGTHFEEMNDAFRHAYTKPADFLSPKNFCASVKRDEDAMRVFRQISVEMLGRLPPQ